MEAMMSPAIANALVALVALIQAAIAVTEIFLWHKPLIHRRLAFDADEARKVAAIVANAGLYNAFLAAGLLWGLLAPGDGVAIKLFFLACVAVAGIFGAVTLKKTTLVLQTAPAVAALLAL